MTPRIKARWKNRATGEVVTGHYRWSRDAGEWVIVLDARCKYTGRSIALTSNDDDRPGWGDWVMEWSEYAPPQRPERGTLRSRGPQPPALVAALKVHAASMSDKWPENPGKDEP